MKTIKKPLVTIAIPTYDRPELLKRTLNSVSRQSYSNLEVLVSDDCSPSLETKVIVQHFQKLDQRICYFRQKENLHYEKNFEFLLQKSNGDYIMWLSDDDMLHENAIHELVSAMLLNENAILCGCDIQFVDENDVPTKTEVLSQMHNCYSWERNRKLFFAYPTSNVYLIIVGLYKRSIFQEFSIRQEQNCHGYYTNLEVPYLARLSVIGEIIVVPKTLFFYRSHGDSTYIKEIAKMSRLEHFLLGLCVRKRLFMTILSSQFSVGKCITLLYVIFLSGVKGFLCQSIVFITPSWLRVRLKKIMKINN